MSVSLLCALIPPAQWLVLNRVSKIGSGGCLSQNTKRKTPPPREIITSYFKSYFKTSTILTVENRTRYTRGDFPSKQCTNVFLLLGKGFLWGVCLFHVDELIAESSAETKLGLTTGFGGNVSQSSRDTSTVCPASKERKFEKTLLLLGLLWGSKMMSRKTSMRTRKLFWAVLGWMWNLQRTCAFGHGKYLVYMVWGAIMMMGGISQTRE